MNAPDPPFQPDLRQGRPIAAVNAAFLAQAQEFQLQFQCDACSFVRDDGGCAHGFPTTTLRRTPFALLDSHGHCQLCKSFEHDEG